MRRVCSVAVAVAALVWSAGARATLVEVQLTGHVLNIQGLDVTGVFGPPNTSLVGDAYAATITYDTASAPADLYPANPNYGYYQRTAQGGGPSFLSISVTINGHTETVNGLTNYQQATVDPTSATSVYFATSNHGPVTPGSTSFDESFADFTLGGNGVQGIVSSDALPTSVDASKVYVPPGSKVGDLLIQRGVSGTLTAYTQYLYLGLDNVGSWSPVPEPTTGSLLGSALLACGVLRSARRRALR